VIFTVLVGNQLGAPVSAALADRKPGNTPSENGAQGKGPAAPDHPPVVEPKVEATWSEQEIVAAQEECGRLLGPLGITIEIAKPLRTGQCGTPAPIVLRRVGAVEIMPPAVVNCRIAAKLSEWVEQKLQPLAKEVLDARVLRIVNASAYTCRQRVGSRSDRLSEHSLANALDVSHL
jgi:hypothetical protein